MKLKHLGLFEGIGGFSLAARWAGWETVAWCEINPFCQQVLKKHFPDAVGYGDIKETDFKKYAGSVDIITGGFPCQPYSQAGKRLGKEDERHRWPEMLRAIREVQPRWIVGENVLGLVNWSGGMVFLEVQADLEAAGYEVQAYVLPACAKDAPHRRDRIWIVAQANAARQRRNQREGEIKGDVISDTNSFRRGGERQSRSGNGSGTRHQSIGKNKQATPDTGLQRPEIGQQQPMGAEQLCKEWLTTNAGSQQREDGAQDSIAKNRAETGSGLDNKTERPGNFRDATNSKRIGQQGQGWPERPGDQTQDGKGKASWSYDDGRWPTESPLCTRNDGVSSQLDGITFSKWRQNSIQAAGNAIVPQVAYEIFKTINQYEHER